MLQKIVYTCFLILIFSLSASSCSIRSELLEELNHPVENPDDYASKQLTIIRKLKKRRMRADSLMEAALAFSKEHKLPRREALLYFHEFYYAYRESSFHKDAEKLIGLMDSLGDEMPEYPELKLNAYSAKAWYLRYKKSFPEALKYYQLSVEHVRKHNMVKHISNIHIRFGLCYSEMQDYYKALEQFNLALETEEPNYIYVYANLPPIYTKLEDWENVLLYGKKAYELCKTENQHNPMIYAGYFMGLAHLRMENFEKAESILLENWNILMESDIKKWDALILGLIIEMYIQRGEIDKALSYEKYLSTIQHQDYYPRLLTRLGEAHLIKNNLPKALKYCNNAKTKVSEAKEFESELNFQEMEACNCLHQVYTKQNKIEKAYQELVCFNSTRKIVEEQAAARNAARAVNQLKLDKQKEMLLMEQDQKDALYAAELSRYKLGGTLVLIILFISGLSLVQLRKRNQHIKTQNQVISNSLEEKEILLKEIHHRVKNNLQVVSGLLKWQSAHITDDVALHAINEGQHRVQSMALIHQKLYQSENLKGIKMDEYIQRLTESLFHSYNIKADKIQLKTDIQNIGLDIETVIPLGLILNELISNSLKHAFNAKDNGQLYVSLTKNESDNAIQMCVKDDGPGMREDALNNRTSFGWELIETLCEKLDGDLEIDNSSGTLVQLNFRNYKTA